MRRQDCPCGNLSALDENFVAPARLRQADAAVIVQPAQPLGDLELGRLGIGEPKRAEAVKMMAQPARRPGGEGRQDLGPHRAAAPASASDQVSISSS